MTVFHAAILAIVQGITEFLPISSDGHLVVADYFLGAALKGRDALGFDILLHAGSLCAILIGFRDVWMPLAYGALRGERGAWRLVGLIVLATIPGVIAGLFFEDFIATQLRSLEAAGLGFLMTALMLIWGEHRGHRTTHSVERVGVLDALFIGIGQAIAILPGVSRSGMTVSIARALGLPRDKALSFSFLLAIPIIGGAVAKTLLDALHGDVVFPALEVSATGFIVSFGVSLLAIMFLRLFVLRWSFAWFAWYLIPLAMLLFFEASGLHAFLLDEHNVRMLVAKGGPVIVFLFAFVEVIPPICFVSPGILAFIVAGSLSKTIPSLVAFIAAIAAGTILGNTLLYVLGRTTGDKLITAMRVTPHHRKQAHDVIERFGPFGVFFGQFVGSIRPVVAFVAGSLRMAPWHFFPWVTCAAVLWASFFVLLGFILRHHVFTVLWVVGLAGAIPITVVLIAGGIHLVRTSRKNAVR